MDRGSQPIFGWVMAIRSRTLKWDKDTFHPMALKRISVCWIDEQKRRLSDICWQSQTVAWYLAY